MYSLDLNPNRMLFVCALFAGFLSVWRFPLMFPDKMVEVPLIAFFLGEIGIALFVTVLVYESASLTQILQLASSVVGFSLLVGAVGNFFGQTTQFLPDSYLLISWVQVVIMNLTGFLTTVSLYSFNNNEEKLSPVSPTSTSSPDDKSTDYQMGAVAQVATSLSVSTDDAKPTGSESLHSKEPVQRPESLKEILDQLDVSRINKLERSLHPEEISLETLFSEESHAAQIAMSPRDLPALSAPKIIKAITQTPDVQTSVHTGSSGEAESQLVPDQVANATIPLESHSTDDTGSSLEDDSLENLSLSSSEKNQYAKTNIEEQSVANLVTDENEVQESPALVENPLLGSQQDLPPDTEDSLKESMEDELAPTKSVLKKTMRGVKIPFKQAAKKKDSPGSTEKVEDLPQAHIESASSLSSTNVTSSISTPSEVSSSFQELLKQEKFESFSQVHDSTNVPPSEERQDEQATLETQNIFDQNAVDKEVEDVFKRLVPKAAQREVSPAELKKLREAQTDNYVLDEQMEIDLELSKLDKEGELIAIHELLSDESSGATEDDSERIKRILEAAAARRNKTSETDTASEEEEQDSDKNLGEQPAKEIKKFGRLASTPKGSKPDSTTGGTMKSIGKMLIDTQAVENIIKAAEITASGLTTARVVNVADGEGLMAFLQKIDDFEGSAGSILTGHDGLVIAASTADETDKESLGALSISILGNNNLATQELELGKLRQIVLQSKDNMIIFINLPIGVLSIFSDVRNLKRVDDLFEHLSGYVLTDFPKLSQATLNVQQLKSAIEELNRTAPADTTTTSKVTDTESQDEKRVHSFKQEQETGSDQTEATEKVKPESEVSALCKGTEELVKKSEEETNEKQDREPVAASKIKDLIEELTNKEQGLVSDSHEQTPESTIEDQTISQQTSKFPIKTTQTDVKEFGRLSNKSSAPITVESAEAGSMKAIGKLLIDTKALENIIKAGESPSAGLTTARVISAARGEGIRMLLARIDNYSGVIGSLIVGHDGLVIASTLTKDLDKELLGALSSSIHNNTNVAIGKLELGQLNQVILQSTDKITILTNVDVGVLAVLCDQRKTDEIDGLLEAIEVTIHS